MKTVLCCLLPLAMFCSSASAEVLLLENLLGDTQHAAGVLQADSELTAANSELERDRAEKGWRFTGAVGYGHIQDVVDEGRTISYQAANAQLGLSYPLFGTAEKQSRTIGGSGGKVEERRLRAEAARRLAQLELETSYARYWGAQESLQLIDAYLESEALLMPRLQQRQEKKMMLGSQLVDLGTAYGKARADRAQFLAVRNDARARLERLTGRKLAELEAQMPELPAAVEMPPVEALQRHPELAALRVQRETLEQQREKTRWYGVDGAFNVTANTVHDTTNAQTGSNAAVGLSMSAPVSLGRARRAEKDRMQAEIDTLQLRYRQRQEELLAQMAAARDKLAQQGEEVSVAAQKSRAAHEALRERLLRSGVFAEDGVETLTARLAGYYGNALAEIDTRVKAWLGNVDARAYVLAMSPNDRVQRLPASGATDVGARLAEPIVVLTRQMRERAAAPGQPAPLVAPARWQEETRPPLLPPVDAAVPVPSSLRQARWDAPPSGTMPAPQLTLANMLLPSSAAAAPTLIPAKATSQSPARPPAAGAARRDDMGVYIWNSRELVSQLQNRDRFWRTLDRLGIRRLLVSLDAAQIREVKARPETLAGFLQNARKRGVAVELLLGEPTWIEARNRPDLVELVSSLWDFSFDGLHLDIEPDQIYKQPLTREQFDNWVKTMAAAARASPWPTAISVHPRYFRDEPYVGWKLGERLAEAGIRDVTLMIFNSNPQRVADTARPIIAALPQLRFRVAQSVEPQLDVAESHARRSRADFENSMRQLQNLLKGQANADGIVVQAWADLMRMGYESEIR